MQVGEDVDGNGTIDLRAMSCTGGFGTDNAEGTFFIGVTAGEGLPSDVLVGWGKSLCSTRTNDWDADYTISLSTDGGVTQFDTKLSFTCQANKSKDPQMYTALS